MALDMLDVFICPFYADFCVAVATNRSKGGVQDAKCNVKSTEWRANGTREIETLHLYTSRRLRKQSGDST